MMVLFLSIQNYLPLAFDDTDPLIAFAAVPAITVASWTIFLISERSDAWIYDLFHIKIRAKKPEDWWKYLWIRNVFSDVLSLALDSLIFIPLAFLIYPSIQALWDPTAQGLIKPIDVIISLIIGQIVSKWILGVIDTPFMYLTRWIYDNTPPKSKGTP